MMPKKPGTYSLEDLAPRRDPSTPVVKKAPTSADQMGGVGRDVNTYAAHPPSEAVLQRAAEPSSPRGGVARQDPEYEEVDDLDLIYERTGTLCFPYPSRKVESGVRATDSAVARPEVTRAPSVWSELSAVFPLGRRLSGARAAPAGARGVSMLAAVDVVRGEPASAGQRREPSTPPAVARAKANGPSSTSAPPALVARRALPQQVAVGPAFPPARRHSAVANRALTQVNHTIVAPPSSPSSRHPGPGRGREARSPAQLSNGKRTAQTSRRTRPPALRTYPTFGQRVRAEVDRIQLAKWSAALGVLAALVVAGVFVASSVLVPKRVPRASVAPRSSVAAVVDQRVLVPAPIHPGPRVSVIVAEEAQPELPNMLDRPALDAQLTDARPKGARTVAPSNRRAPTRTRTHERCDCFPGDPLCGCLD